MAHTYQSVTTPSTSYTSVSPIRPVGDKEDQLTWANLNSLALTTWNKLGNSGKVHWVDWWYGDVYVDDYTSITTQSQTYKEVTS